jgi:hypothetical protein
MPGPDGIHGTGTYSNTIVVGKFLGAQMSAMTGQPPLALIDHLPDGQAGVDDNVYTNGTTATVTAVPNPGYRFTGWTENGTLVSAVASYTFTNIVNRSLIANFIPAPALSVTTQGGALVLTWPTSFPGFTLQQNTNLNSANWTAAAKAISTVGNNYQAVIQTTNGPRFFRLV